MSVARIEEHMFPYQNSAWDKMLPSVVWRVWEDGGENSHRMAHGIVLTGEWINKGNLAQGLALILVRAGGLF